MSGLGGGKTEGKKTAPHQTRPTGGGTLVRMFLRLALRSHVTHSGKKKIRCGARISVPLTPQTVQFL